MCHTVDRTAKRPRVKYAYKAVDYTEVQGVYESPHASRYIPRKVRWKVGRVVRAVGLGRGDKGYNHLDQSTAGIYVFRRFKDAKESAAGFMRTVIRVEVDPKDWLTTSACGDFVTYRKAKMVAVVKGCRLPISADTRG